MDPRIRIAGAALADLVLVLVFVGIGRESHREAMSAAELFGTAWPFLVGLAVGWAIARAWRAPLAMGRTGAPVWLATVVVGLLLRAVTGQGVAVPFLVVATLVLAALLVGWRALVEVLDRRSRRPRAYRRF